jgi:hypothetical protein
MKDRFTDASAELSGNNPYVCDSCVTTFGHASIEHHGEETRMHGSAGDPSTCLLNCDPMPFGD